MDTIARYLSRASDSAAVLGGLAVGLMIVHITLDVVLRFVLDLPISGTILLVSLMYMPMITFLPLAYAEKKDAHISVELIYDRLPGAVQRSLDVLSLGLSVVVYVALAIRTWSEAMAKFRIGASEMEGSLRIPTWPSYYLLPIGFALIVAILVFRIACLVTSGRPAFVAAAGVDDAIEETHSV